MQFSELWGEELTLQLSSKDGDTGGTNKLFTAVRRKKAVNQGAREFVRLTECVVKRGTLSLSDGTAEYDLEATLTDFWWLSEQEGITVKVVDGDGNTTYYVEGKDLTRVSLRRLDREHPGWRSADPGTPRYLYERRDGGQRFLGLYPAPDVGAGETWTALVPYIPSVADMSDAADIPFTFSGNAARWLEPWHMAPVHWAAAKLEKARKNVQGERDQLGFFAALVKDYHDKQKAPGGDVVTYAHDYLAPSRTTAYAGDGMVDW